MAIRKSKEESNSVRGSLEEVQKKCKSALELGGFTSIKNNAMIGQLTANYKKFAVWGEIAVTLKPKDGSVGIHVKSTSNADNIFALFSSSNQKIINQFKNNLL
jgi:hypothetical protein